MECVKTRVCIIGSGIAGCLCAKYLSDKVKDILIVERGARVTHTERLRTGEHEKNIPTAQHHHVMLGDYKRKIFQYVYAMGGTTNHWLGQTPRLLPSDFRMKSLYGVMEDWPVSYEDLEPYLCLAEKEMAVVGSNENKYTPRSQPYPLSPHPFSPQDQLIKRCFPEGSLIPVACARPTQPVGVRPACCGSATCGLCPVDSKYTPMNSHIPELEASPTVRFMPETVILSLATDGRRKVTKAFAKQNDGKEICIEADLFILAANALENPAIILRSQGLPQHPLVGKYLADHTGFWVAARISQDGFPSHGNSIVTAHLYHFYDGDFRRKRSAALGEIYNPPQLHPAYFVPDAALRGLHGKALRDEVAKQFRYQLTFSFLLEEPPILERFIRIGSRRNKLGIPETEVFYTRYGSYVQQTRDYILGELRKSLAPLGPRDLVASNFAPRMGHILGTCRMGDSKTGVVDTSLRYHELDNLYILGGSAFPTYGATNPTLTIAALAIQLGTQLRRMVA